MRNRLGISLFTATVAGSAAAHVLVLATFSNVRVGSARLPEFAEMTVVYADPSDPPGRDPSEFDIGRPGATGYATHDLDGRREQFAREAPQDQASLSLDPVGTSPRVELPSTPGAAEYAPPAAAAPPVAANTAAPPLIAPRLPPEIGSVLLRDRVGSIAPDVPPAAPDPPAPAPADVEVAAAAPPASNRAPPAAGSGADPAPQSDSESDAFSVLGSAQFRAGRVTVQSGRRVKPRRPKVGLSGMVQLAQRTTAEVVLNVSVDASGNVTNVDVARSSGSNDIDQPCRVAMYDWWFEPRKDAAGRPVPDEFRFTISFR